MSTQVTTHELSNETRRVLDLVESGVDVVVTRRGVPVAALCRPPSAKDRRVALRAMLAGVGGDSGLLDEVAESSETDIAVQAEQGHDPWTQ